MSLTRAQKPFHFYTRLHLPELTGIKAVTVPELLEHIREVPGAVIYHHTHHFLQQHQYLSPEPPNDFAYWVTEVLQEKALGERLNSVNICEFKSIRSLREKFISILETYLQKAKFKTREAHPEEAFHFIKSVSYILPTPHQVYDLNEFLSVFRKITVHSLYYHMFEAKLRLERGDNDFSMWFEEEVKEKELAQKVSILDPYTHTMEGLRAKIILLIEKRLAQERVLEEARA